MQLAVGRLMKIRRSKLSVDPEANQANQAPATTDASALTSGTADAGASPVCLAETQSLDSKLPFPVELDTNEKVNDEHLDDEDDDEDDGPESDGDADSKKSWDGEGEDGNWYGDTVEEGAGYLPVVQLGDHSPRLQTGVETGEVEPLLAEGF